MSVLIRAKDLKDAIKTLGITKNDDTIPLDTYIKITQENGHINLSRQTLDYYINVRLPIANSNEKSGETPINATVDKKKLERLINRIDNEMIIGIENGSINKNELIISGDDKTKIFTYYISSIEGYAINNNIKSSDYQVYFETRGDYLLEWLDMVSFAVSTKDTIGSQIAGIHINVDNNSLCLEATDTTVLSRIVIEDIENYLSNLNGIGSTIVPVEIVRSVENMCRIIGTSKIKIFYNTTEVVFENDSTIIRAKSIKQPYPDTDRIIKTHNVYKFVTFGIIECIEAICRLITVVNNDSPKVKIRFSDNLMYIEIRSSTYDYGIEVIDIINNGISEDLSIVIDARKLLMILKSIKDEGGAVDMGIESVSNTIIFTPANENTYNHRVIVIPACKRLATFGTQQTNYRDFIGILI